MTRPRLVLADDHTSFVGALRRALEPDYDVVATVADGWSLLETAPQINPEVIVVDIAMPLINGLEAGLRPRQQTPDVKLIFLTMNGDLDLAAEAMRCGPPRQACSVSSRVRVSASWRYRPSVSCY
jgi:DNA-binding NarL/FixJ family response regulator